MDRTQTKPFTAPTKKQRLLAGLFGIGIGLLGCGKTEFSSGNRSGNTSQSPPGTSDQRPEPGNTASLPDQIAEHLPTFGLMVNDLQCGMCHMKVHGDVVSTRSVPALFSNSYGIVKGDWHINGSYNGHAAGGIVNVTGKLDVHTKANVPRKFPLLDFDAIKGSTIGNLTGGQNIDQHYEGNLVLTGTESEPIHIEKDIFVSGDLIISGRYTGIGTIYVTGNIYIPADLVAVNSAFPYTDDQGAALEEAQGRLGLDGLGLAAKGSILIGDISLDGGLTGSPPASQLFPKNHNAVFNWYPRVQFEKLQKSAIHCKTQQPTQTSSVNVVDAFLYSQGWVAGINRLTSFSIRGGVIADVFHVLNAMTTRQTGNPCSTEKNALHNRESNFSHIEYDYRLQTGDFFILEFLAKTMMDDAKAEN